MGHSKQKQSEQKSVTLNTTLAKTLAPEDIRIGDFVTIEDQGLRDGLQSVRGVLPTALKLSLIADLEAAGLRRIQ